MYFDRERDRFQHFLIDTVWLLGTYDRRAALDLIGEICSNSMLCVGMAVAGDYDMNHNLETIVHKLWKMELDEFRSSLRLMVSDSRHFLQKIYNIENPTQETMDDLLRTVPGYISEAYTDADKLDCEFVLVIPVTLDALAVLHSLEPYRMFEEVSIKYDYFVRIFRESLLYACECGFFPMEIYDLHFSDKE